MRFIWWLWFYKKGRFHSRAFFPIIEIHCNTVPEPIFRDKIEDPSAQAQDNIQEALSPDSAKTHLVDEKGRDFFDILP